MTPNDSLPNDPLRDLLQAAAAVQAPAHDLAFTLDVMARVERRRFVESVAWLVAGTLLAALLLALVMPYVTPSLASAGTALWPAALVLSLIAAGLFGLEQTRRYTRLG